MSISNYSEIKAELQTMLARSDVGGRFDRAIRLVETDINRLQVKPIDMRETTTINTVAGTATVNMPSDYLSAVEMSLSDNPRKLDQVGIQQLNDSYAGSTSGRPKVFATFKKRVMKLGPTPDAVYTIDLLYNKEVPALDQTTTTTNWLTEEYPGVYLYGAAYKIMLELRDAEQIAKYESLYNGEIAKIEAQNQAEKYAREPMQQRPKSGSIA